MLTLAVPSCEAFDGAAQDAYDLSTFVPDADCFRADALTLIYRTRA